MAKFKDLSKQTFTRLTVISRAQNDKRGHARWDCQCICGNTLTVLGYSLTCGETKSCGCLKKESCIQRHTTHGMARSSEHNIWCAMIQRCINPNNKAFKNYGGRGITVCDEWRNNFLTFLKDMGNRPSKQYSIERINNNLGYSPNNCKWATKQEQTNNSRSNIKITLQEWTMNLSQWAQFVGLKHETLCCRIFKYGWPISKAIFQPIKKHK